MKTVEKSKIRKFTVVCLSEEAFAFLGNVTIEFAAMNVTIEFELLYHSIRNFLNKQFSPSSYPHHVD